MLLSKFKRGELVRWNALSLHGHQRDGWRIEGLQRRWSLLPIYRVRKGSDVGSAVETELERVTMDTTCGTTPEHLRHVLGQQSVCMYCGINIDGDIAGVCPVRARDQGLEAQGI